MLIKILFIVIGIIHIIPIIGVLGIGTLNKLYGINIDSGTLEIVLRHRAVLFGLLGSLFIYSAFKPDLQVFSLFVAFVSMISFIVISYLVGDFNRAILKVIYFDVAGLIALAIIAMLKVFSSNQS